MSLLATKYSADSREIYRSNADWQSWTREMTATGLSVGVSRPGGCVREGECRNMFRSRRIVRIWDESTKQRATRMAKRTSRLKGVEGETSKRGKPDRENPFAGRAMAGNCTWQNLWKVSTAIDPVFAAYLVLGFHISTRSRLSLRGDRCRTYSSGRGILCFSLILLWDPDSV